MTSPRRFTSGPPELPGLIDASVWMKFSYVVIPTSDRPVALTTPTVRLVEPERVADRDRPLTDAELVRVAQRGHGERRRRFEPYDGEIGLGVGADDPPAGLLLRRQAHDDSVGAADDVEVRQNVAPVVDDDARAEPRLMELFAAPRAAPEELVEKVLERGVVGERPERRGTAYPGDLDRADMDHGRADALGHADKGGL